QPLERLGDLRCLVGEDRTRSADAFGEADQSLCIELPPTMRDELARESEPAARANLLDMPLLPPTRRTARVPEPVAGDAARGEVRLERVVDLGLDERRDVVVDGGEHAAGAENARRLS